MSIRLTLPVFLLLGTSVCQSDEIAIPATKTAAGSDTYVCEDLAGDLRQARNMSDSRHLNEALYEAASLDCVGIAADLLAKGASVAARNARGATPLSVAAAHGARDVAAYFLKSGAQIDSRDLSGATPLLAAASAERRRLAADLIAAGADPDAVDKQGLTALAAAAFNGDGRLVKILLDASVTVDREDRSGKVALIYASGRAYTDIVAQLLDAGADADGVWGHDLTPLMWAAGHANDAPATDGVATAKLLLDAGADVARRDDRGRDALMTAAARGHGDMIEFLLANGADPNRTDNSGNTARDLAVSDDIKALLSDQGASRSDAK